jgi:pimeloyl-ACP methyl ester carboxylesterase
MRRRIAIGVTLGALFATAAIVATRYHLDIDQARARLAHSSIANTRCGPIEYSRTGEGPAVLVVHGAGGGFDQGESFGAPLVAAGHSVVAMSRFGYLRTARPADASAEAQADAHACLLDALGIRRAAVIGASAGAPSSMQLAIRHPERVTALVLLVPAVYVPRAGGAPPVATPAGTQLLFETALDSDFLFWAASHLARGTVTRAVLATPPEVVANASPSERERVAGVMAGILPVSLRRAGLLNDARVTSTLPRYDLERIQAPTLAISVADDLFGTFDSARYTAARVRDGRFVGYLSGGHVWVGHQADVMSTIGQFLDAHGR